MAQRDQTFPLEAEVPLPRHIETVDQGEELRSHLPRETVAWWRDLRHINFKASRRHQVIRCGGEPIEAEPFSATVGEQESCHRVLERVPLISLGRRV